jgi:hypothetical protein
LKKVCIAAVNTPAARGEVAASGRAHGAEQMGPLEVPIAAPARTLAADPPAEPGAADMGFVHEPSASSDPEGITAAVAAGLKVSPNVSTAVNSLVGAMPWRSPHHSNASHAWENNVGDNCKCEHNLQ